MLGLSIPKTLTDTSRLTGMVVQRHLDEAIAKEEAKQLNHELSVTQHAEAQAAKREVSALTHDKRIAGILTGSPKLTATEQTTVDAFRAKLSESK